MSGGSATLILVCGLPGSGKTTHATALERELSACRLSPDDWMEALGINLHDEGSRERIEQLQWKLGKRLLALGLTVIIEWGTWGRWERDRLRQDARELGVSVELHYLTTPAHVLFERIQMRGREDPPIRWESIQSWLEIFEVPAPEEVQAYDFYHYRSDE